MNPQAVEKSYANKTWWRGMEGGVLVVMALRDWITPTRAEAGVRL